MSGPAGEPVPRRLRVVIPSLSYFPDHPTGLSRLAYDEARHLAALGHEVWVIAHTGNPVPREHVVDQGLHVLRYHAPRWSALDPRRRNVHYRSTARLLQRHVGPGVDVVHCHALQSGAAAMARCRGARTCYSLHSPVGDELRAAGRLASPPERLRLRASATLNNRLERWCLLHADAVTCESRFTRTRVEAMHGAGVAARFVVVPGWVDVDRFRVIADRLSAKRQLGWPVDCPVLFSLRRFVPRTGLDVLLQAAARLNAAGRSFHLVIAGEGELRSRLEALRTSLNLSSTVTFPGLVSENQLPVMYGAADAFVLPSADLECFGLIAIEAMGCGRPVLATPVGAIPEVIGRVEPRWIAGDASAGSLAALLDAFLQGRVPVPSPDQLHAFVARHYSVHDRVAELARVALGEPPAQV